MKHIFKTLLVLITGAALLNACKKDENQVLFQGGVAPEFSSDNVSGVVFLSKPTADQVAITFSWTNPDYRMNTGISSHNVNYAIQMREKDSANFVTVDVVSSVLSKSYTQGQINGYLFGQKTDGGLQVPENAVRMIETRVVSFLGDTYSATNPTNLASEVVSFTVDKVYSVYPDLWITGEAVPSGWTNTPPANQKFEYNPTTRNHTIRVQLIAGIYYKFLTVNGQWQPQWGVEAGTTTDVLNQQFSIKENPGNTSDPDAIKAPASGGLYTITVNLGNKTTVVSQ